MTSFAGFADILNRVGSKTCKRSHRKRQKRPNRELRKKSNLIRDALSPVENVVGIILPFDLLEPIDMIPIIGI